MHQLVKKWINGNQEYYTGIALLKACKASDALYLQLKQGPNDFNRRKLKECLMLYYQQSKIKTSTSAEKNISVPIPKLENENVNNVAVIEPVVNDYSDTSLYIACKKEADNLYKEVMNKRAILFSSIRSLMPYEDANTPDKIDTRRKSSIDIALDFQRVSKLYDRADYVKKNGKLPFTDAEVIETNIDGIPDALLKQNIDNLRKNINKMKKREQTPERVALVQSHEQKLNLLLARWQLLKLEQ